MYEDLLTLGFLASFEMLSAAFLQAWSWAWLPGPPGGFHTR